MKIKKVVKNSEKSERIPANEKRKQFVKKKTSKAGTVLIKWNISVFRKKGNKLNFIFSYFCQGGVEIKINSKNKFQYWQYSNWEGKNIENCGKSKTSKELKSEQNCSQKHIITTYFLFYKWISLSDAIYVLYLSGIVNLKEGGSQRKRTNGNCCKNRVHTKKKLEFPLLFALSYSYLLIGGKIPHPSLISFVFWAAWFTMTD